MPQIMRPDKMNLSLTDQSQWVRGTQSLFVFELSDRDKRYKQLI
ncbi:hypothetical protein SynMITS9220_00233 [Synechococcus sp. MIT S9220]|nr:hypothetical protein SynMITS9220_00233 [Synechococcus sp. MIT S9220]